MSSSLAPFPVVGCPGITPVSVDLEYLTTAQRYHKRFYGAAFRILRNHAEAEDAIQEAHVRALAHLDQFEGRAALSTWVMQIVTNEALMGLRRRVPSVDLDGVTLRSTIRSPEEEAVRGQLRALVLAGIQALPPPYRSAFFSREVCDMSAAETAASLGITVGCVKTRLHRAKALLRKRLSAQLKTAHTSAGLSSYSYSRQAR